MSTTDDLIKVRCFEASKGESVNAYIGNLKKSVFDYAAQADCVYIGITGDLENRGKAHHRRSKKPTQPGRDPGAGWTRGIAIYNTTKPEDAKMAEKLLIKYLRACEKHAYKCLNKSMGGELVDLFEHYYVYVLLGPRNVRQRYWYNS